MCIFCIYIYTYTGGWMDMWMMDDGWMDRLIGWDVAGRYITGMT